MIYIYIYIYCPECKLDVRTGLSESEVPFVKANNKKTMKDKRD